MPGKDIGTPEFLSKIISTGGTEKSRKVIFNTDSGEIKITLTQ